MACVRYTQNTSWALKFIFFDHLVLFYVQNMIWDLDISFNSFCNKEIEFQFESIYVYIWAFLTKATKQWKNNWKFYWKSYWRFYLHLLNNWRQFKQLKNCPRHTHRTPNTCRLSLKFFETIRVETCHFPYLKNHTSISFYKKITIKSNFLGKNPSF